VRRQNDSRSFFLFSSTPAPNPGEQRCQRHSLPSATVAATYPLFFEFVADKLQSGDNFMTNMKTRRLYDL
jgi:hypothetical protein